MSLPERPSTARLERPSRVIRRRELDFKLGSFIVQKKLLSSCTMNLCYLELSEKERGGQMIGLAQLLVEKALLPDYQVEALKLQLVEEGKIQEETGDLLIGRLVLERGLADPETVRACLERQAELAREGRQKMLGELLVERGVLSAEAVRDLLARHRRRVLACAKCGARYNVRGFAAEKAYRCKRCHGPLAEESPSPPPTALQAPAPPARLEEVKEYEDSSSEPGLDSDDFIPGMTDRHFAGYEILEKIAEGTMGHVFKVRKDAKVYALKVLKEAQDEQNEARVMRFKGEARACKKINHPYVVHVYDEGVHQGHHWFAMDYIEGHSLKEYIEAGRLRLDEGISAVVKVAEALAAAHEAGVIHRDLKPANILIGPTGEPVITDFGLARDLADNPRITRAGFAVGTPNYMAPEQVRGESHLIGPCTDVYALGVILYQILTGEVPYRASTTPELFIRIDQGSPIPPSAKNPNVTRKLERICLTAMRRDPTKRWKSAAEFAEGLQSVLPAGKLRLPGYRERKRSRRRKERFFELVSEGRAALEEGRHGEALALFQQAAQEAEEPQLLLKNLGNFLTTTSEEYVSGSAFVLLRLEGIEGHRPLMEALIAGNKTLERALVRIADDRVIEFLAQATRSRSQFLKTTAARLVREIHHDKEIYLRIWLLPDKSSEVQKADLLYIHESLVERGKDPAEVLTEVLGRIDERRCDQIGAAFARQSEHFFGLSAEMRDAGRIEDVARWLDLCLLYSPANQLALLARAELHQKNGQRQKALQDFKRAFKLSPGNQALQQHIARLEPASAVAQPTDDDGEP